VDTHGEIGRTEYGLFFRVFTTLDGWEVLLGVWLLFYKIKMNSWPYLKTELTSQWICSTVQLKCLSAFRPNFVNTSSLLLKFKYSPWYMPIFSITWFTISSQKTLANLYKQNMSLICTRHCQHVAVRNVVELIEIFLLIVPCAGWWWRHFLLRPGMKMDERWWKGAQMAEISPIYYPIRDN
jgi:hypothetical protein